MLASYVPFHTNSYTINKANFLDLLYPQLKVPSGRCTRMNELSQTHLNWQEAAKRKQRNLEGNRVELATSPQYNNSFCAHIPMWRLSRLQNLAISPLATILLFEKQPHSEQDWGVTEHHRESHRLSATETAEIAYSRLWRCVHSRPEPARRLTARSLLRAARVGGSRRPRDVREETLNSSKASAYQTQTHSPAYQVWSRAFTEGGRDTFAAFNYNPKGWVRLSESF